MVSEDTPKEWVVRAYQSDDGQLLRQFGPYGTEATAVHLAEMIIDSMRGVSVTVEREAP